MSSTGENSSARNLVSGRQRKKKQFRRGANSSTTNKPVAETIKQRTHACAEKGNSRKRSRSFIGTPVRQREFRGSNRVHQDGAAPDRRGFELCRELARPVHFCRLYSAWPKNPGARMVSVRLTYVIGRAYRR